MAYDTISAAAGPLNPAYAWLYSGARIGSLKYLVMADDIITTPSTPHVPPNSPTDGTQLSLSHWKRSSRRVGRMAGLVNSKFNKKTRMAANNQARSQSARDKQMAAEVAGRLKEDIAEWEQWRARVLAGRPPDPPFLFPLRSLPPFAQASLSVESVTTVPKEYPELSPTECTSHSQVFSYSTLYSLSCESTSGNHASRSSSLERCRAPSPRSTRPNLAAAAPPPTAASPLHYKSCLMTPSPLMSPPPSPPRSPSPHSLHHAFTSNPPPQLRPVADRRWSNDRMADKRRSTQDVKSTAGSHSPSRMTFNDSSSLSPALHEIMSSPAWRSQRVTLGQDREDKPSFTLPDPHRVSSSRNAKLARNKGDGHHVFRGLSQESIELKEEEINYAVECIRQTKQNKIKQKMQRFSKWAEDKDKGIAQKIIEILSNAGDSAKLVGSEVSTKRVERSSKEINVRRSGSNEMQEVQKEKSLRIRKSLDSIQITQTRFTGSCENPISQTTASLSNVSQSQGYPVDETETLYSKIDSSIPGDATQNTGNCYKQHTTSRSWSSPFLVTDKKCKFNDTKINTHDVYDNDKDTNVTNNGEPLQQTDNSLVDEVAIDSKGWELKTNTPYPGTNEILIDSVNMNALTTEIETNEGKMPENDNFGSKRSEWIYRPHGPNYVELYNSNKQTTMKRKMPIKTILKKPTVCVRNITIEQSANILKGKIFQSNNVEIIPVRDSLKSRLKALLGKDDPSQVHTMQHNVPSSNSSKSGIQAKPLTTEPTIRQLHPKNKTKGQAQTETIVQRVVLNNSLTPTKRILNYRCSTDSSRTHDDSTNISRSLNNEETVSGPTNLDSNINDVEEEIKVYEFSPQASNDEYFPNEWNLPQIQVDQKVVGKRSQVTVKSASHTCPTPHNTCVSLSSSDTVNFENVEPVNASPPTQENIILQNNNECKLQQDATSSSIHTPNVRVKPTTASTTSTMESLFTSEDSNTLYSLSLNSGGGNYDYWPGTVNAGGVCNKSCIKTKQYNTPYCPNKTGFIATSEECDKNFTVSEPPFSTQYVRDNDGVQWANGCDNIGQYGTNIAKELLADYTSYGFMDPMSRNEPFENAPVINSYGTNELTNYLDELTTTATYFPRSSTFPDESHAEVFHFPEHVCQSSAGTLPGPNYQTVTANSEDLIRGAVYSPAEHSNVSHTFNQGYSFDTSKEQENEFWAREDENSNLSGDTSQCLLKYNTENDTLIRRDLDKSIVKSNAENSLLFNIGSPKFLKTIHSDKELSLTQNIKRHPNIHQFIKSPGHGPKEQEVLFMNTLHPVDKSPTPSWESAINSDIKNKEVRASTRSALERKTKSASNHSKHSNRISGRSIPKEFSWSSSTNQQPHTSASSEFLSYLENDTELMGKGDGVSIRESQMSAQNKRKHLSPSFTRKLPRPFSTEDDLFLTKKTRLEWVATPLRPATCPDRVRKELVGNKNRLPKNTSEIGTSPRTPPEESKGNERPSSKTIGPKGSFSVRSSKSPQGKRCKKSGSRATPKSRGSTMSGKGRSRELRSAKSSKDRKSESDGDSVTSTRRRHREAERVSESSEWSLLDSAVPDFSELKLTWSSWDAFRDEPANLNEIQQYRNATRKAWRLMGRGDEASSGKTRTPVFPSSRSKKTNPPLQVNNFGTSNSCVEYLKTVGAATGEGEGEDGGGGGADVRLAMFLLRRMGMWRPSADKRRWTDVLYDAYSTFIVVTVFWGIVSFAVAAVQQFDNPPVFSHIVCLELQCIAALLKMLDFLRQREGVRALLRRLRELPLAPGGSDAQRCVQAHAREANLVSTVYTLGGAIAYVIWYAYPLVDNARESAACRRERLSTQQAAEAAGNASYSTSNVDVDCVIFRLPTEAWYPFDVHRLGPYVVAYLHQMEFVWFGYINTNTLDCLWVALMQHVAAHAHCLAERMRSADSAEAMRACVRYHQALYDATRDLQTAMGPGALAQFMASLGIICLALFATMQVDDVVRKMQFGVFVVVMAQELLLFCWYGEAVRSSSEALAAAVYDAPWLRAPPPLRRDWLLVLARAQKPFSLRTAGGFNELSRRTFLSLIQLSYSFFTVLNSTNE